METDRVRAPNIRDVAAKAGVSYQTVSRVLNDSPRIRVDTRDRVLEAIRELGYRPNQAARALVTSRTSTIGVLSTMTAHYGPTTAINAIEVAAREAGYRLVITNSPSSDYDDITGSLDHLLAQSIDALVVLAPQVRVFEAIQELSISVPFVTVESTGRDIGHSISVDQLAGARLATQHLIDLGHVDILHLSGPQDWIEAEARMQGYLRTLGDADLRTRAPVLGDWSAAFGFHAGRELLRIQDFTAVFAGNDQMALGFLHACREAGVDVPGRISVVGFDDIPESAHFGPPLTTVRQDFTEVGRRAIEILLGELRGESEIDHTMVVPQLVVRESTAAPRG